MTEIARYFYKLITFNQWIYERSCFNAIKVSLNLLPSAVNLSSGHALCVFPKLQPRASLCALLLSHKLFPSQLTRSWAHTLGIRAPESEPQESVCLQIFAQNPTRESLSRASRHYIGNKSSLWLQGTIGLLNLTLKSPAVKSQRPDGPMNY